MRKFISGEFMLMAGLFAVPANYTAPVMAMDRPVDPRLKLLSEFLHRLESPVASLSTEFLAAADQHTLDWRLLPSIAVVESSAGKKYKNNNIFGWDSCNKRFPTVRAGIHEVASRLATSKLYRDKDTGGILATYNPLPDYPSRVLRIMRAIGPEEPVVEN